MLVSPTNSAYVFESLPPPLVANWLLVGGLELRCSYRPHFIPSDIGLSSPYFIGWVLLSVLVFMAAWRLAVS